MESILILFHCESNVGYAIGPLERTFFKMALELCDQNPSRIHFAYPSMKDGPSPTLPADFRQYAVIDTRSADPEHFQAAESYIRAHRIDTIFGFDQPVANPIYRHFRRAGVRHFISYWGAPMSSVRSWPIRLLKRLEVSLHREGPDHYIFESHGMADFGVRGRGISRSKVSVVHLGVDTNLFRPDAAGAAYIYEQLNIPRGRRIFFYSGHMEPRKGVAVIMQAANELGSTRDDWHVVLCGNKGRESEPYEKMLTARSHEHVTFAGYRGDVPSLQRGCYAAIVASDGWDSFPRSGVEMQASGLPLLASDLAGLRESIEDGKSGLLFGVGNSLELSSQMERLLANPAWRDQLSEVARTRAEREFSLEAQLSRLVEVVRNVVAARSAKAAPEAAFERE